MNRTECPACLSTNKKIKYNTGEYKILQCIRCDSLYVEKIPPKEDLLGLYKSEDYYSLPSDSVQRIINENKRRVRNIYKLNVLGKVLDIGCVKGLFLDEIKNKRYETYGIEMSEKNVKACLKNGHKVFHGDLNSFFSDNQNKIKFNIITCLDVIEHVESPIHFMKSIYELLDDEGILVLSTPNFSGIVSKFLGNKNPFIIPPEHLNFFSKGGLKELIEKSGFRIIQSETFGYLTKDGLDKAIFKYVPKLFHPFNLLLKPLINYSFKTLNFFSNGLELEFYLKKC